MRKVSAMAAGLCAALLVLPACSSSGGADTTGPVKVGVVTALSGAASSNYAQSENGVKARFAAYQAANGKCAARGFEVVVGDDQSTPQGALTAAQRLVQQEHAYAVLPISTYFYGAGQYAGTQAKATPFIGGAFDGGEQWFNPKYDNLFAAMSGTDYNKAATTLGDYWKKLGGTKVAVVAYNTPSASKAGEGAALAAERAGLSRGYVNERVQVGSTDVGAMVLGIKESGADVLYVPVIPETAFALVSGLRQAGVEMKSVLLATGYGADLLKSPPAVAAAQGVGFLTSYAPVEMNTEATQAWSAALKQFAGSESGLPSFSMAVGWISADLLIHGLEQAGCNASQEQLMTALRADKSWTAGGLFSKPADFENRGSYSVGGPGNCSYVSILRGNQFVPDPAGSPACGAQIPGVTVVPK
ncbi:ABC transporter substrate-binding protein [Nocardia sp. NBC_00565]|uniref:ABC transporter substrate-binding protein n=1 Tax=Nocardia sp. NBC_00565 TaxID=2975993 RepID=UPI002E820125|nr:ABC transporter substrate-binding protein [Nocardia sp. NBC_00565]WUC05810.1 ABC transporter substrate-binding protein [Nocardia sp. NBC_00565]